MVLAIINIPSKFLQPYIKRFGLWLCKRYDIGTSEETSP